MRGIIRVFYILDLFTCKQIILHLPLQFGWFFKNFSCLLALARISSHMMNWGGKSTHLALFLIFRGKVVSFPLLSMMFYVYFTDMALIMLSKCPIPRFFKVFIKECGNLSDWFSCTCWDDRVILILPFVKIVYHIDWIAY